MYKILKNTLKNMKGLWKTMFIFLLGFLSFWLSSFGFDLLNTASTINAVLGLVLIIVCMYFFLSLLCAVISDSFKIE